MGTPEGIFARQAASPAHAMYTALLSGREASCGHGSVGFEQVQKALPSVFAVSALIISPPSTGAVYTQAASTVAVPGVTQVPSGPYSGKPSTICSTEFGWPPPLQLGEADMKIARQVASAMHAFCSALQSAGGGGGGAGAGAGAGAGVPAGAVQLSAEWQVITAQQ